MVNWKEAGPTKEGARRSGVRRKDGEEQKSWEGWEVFILGQSGESATAVIRARQTRTGRRLAESRKARAFHQDKYYSLNDFIRKKGKMRKDLNYVINHASFPPELPQESDAEPSTDATLTEEVLAALRLFQEHLPEPEHLEWGSCIEMVAGMFRLRNDSRRLVAKRVEVALKK